MTICPKRYLWLIALAAWVYPVFVFGNPNGNENDAEVKFTARTDLVLIPTIVTDKSGKHVSGLKREDFTAFENGVEQKIATFEEITSDPHRLARPKNPNEFSN